MEPTDAQEPLSGLGRAITVRRAELGLKRKDLAARSSLSYPYVSELEKGTKEPSARALRQLAEALELSVTQLLERGERFDFVLDDPVTGRTTVAEVKSSKRPPAVATIESQLASLVTALQTPRTSAGSPDTSEVAELVARLVRQELETFRRDELPDLVAAELQKTLAKALQQGSS